jgi:ferrous iron transport protein A
MPLLLAELNVDYTIKHISANEKDRHYLESLGFIPGTRLCVVSKFNGYFLVNIKDSRIGISKDLAKRIILSE